jgi:hypothetical protein
LHELYRWVEHRALETATWYLADRVWKRRGARALRGGAAAGAVVGAALPLLDLTEVADGAARWGYLALLLGNVREVLGPAEGTASEAAERCLGVLRRFSEDLNELVRAETADWMVEFRTGSAPLGIQSALSGGARQDAGAGGGRFPVPPANGARPNMPRQRPPEPR